jgi:hypothetical protein
MATVETITAKIVNKVQDESYTTDAILELMQQLHLELAEGIEVPGERRITPPLPGLFTVGTVYTSPTVSHVAMPTNYQRDLVFCANASGLEVKISDTFIEFAKYYPLMDGIRNIERVAIKGSDLYYQGIEKTTLIVNDPVVALTLPELTFAATGKTITDTSGDKRFLGLVAGQIINVNGTVSNDGNKTIATVAADGSYCTVTQTLVNESSFTALAVVTITAGVLLTVHYYRTPATMTTDADTPEGIPVSLQMPLFEYGVSYRIYDEIEDGIEGQKINTTYNEKRFNESILRLVKLIPDEGPSFFIGPDR